MTGWQYISQFTWDRQDVIRSCDGNKAATQVLEYLLYLLKLRAKDCQVDDINSSAYGFTYTIAYITKKTVFSERSVRRGIKLLRDKGMISVSHPTGFDRTACYHVNLDKIDAWFNEKLPLFPVNYPSHANDDLPCGQVGHIEPAKLTTSMWPSWPHRTGQVGQFILDTNKPNTDTEEEASAASADINALAEKIGIEADACLVIIKDSPPKDLLDAAVDCWHDRQLTVKDKSKENPVRFIRACIRAPGEFGVIKGKDGWRFPKRVRIKDKVNDAAALEAVAKIKQHRQSGDSDPYVASLLKSRYKYADLSKAFELAGGYRE